MKGALDPSMVFPICKENNFILNDFPEFNTLKMNSCLMASFRKDVFSVAFLFHCYFTSHLECPFSMILVWLYLILSSNSSISSHSLLEAIICIWKSSTASTIVFPFTAVYYRSDCFVFAGECSTAESIQNFNKHLMFLLLVITWRSSLC